MAGREVGPVRHRVGGDTLQAKAYTNIARTQLGILKNLMSFNDLKQLSRTVYLGDGTRIFVSSVFGQDSIRIDTPEGVGAEGGAAEQKGANRRIAYVVGVGSGRGTHSAVCRWAFDIVSGDLTKQVLWEFDPATQDLRGEILMSDNGRVVMWSAGLVYEYRISTLYRWDEVNSVREVSQATEIVITRLATPTLNAVVWSEEDPVYGYPRAYRWSINEENEFRTERLWEWIDSTGGYAGALSLSETGDIVCAAYSRGDQDARYRVIRWSSAAGAEIISDNIISDEPSYQYNSPARVSADGTATVWAETNTIDAISRVYRYHVDTGLQTIYESTLYYYDTYPSGVLVNADGSAMSWVMRSAVGSFVLHRWSVAQGAMQPTTESITSQLLMSADGGVLVYRLSPAVEGRSYTYWTEGGGETGVRVPGIDNISSNLHMTPDGGVLCGTGIEYTPEGAVQKAYRWTPSSSVILQSVTGFYTYSVIDLAPDGVVVLGYSVSSEYATFTLWAPDRRTLGERGAYAYQVTAVQ